jgi:EmrB/QacA subfamily drug resistance transporter
MQRLATPRDSRWLVLFVLCAGMLMIILDQTIVNVALPSIQRDLGFTQSGLAWVVNAYLIAFGGLLLLAGRLGDLIGRKRIFVTGLVAFTAASFLCGVAASPEMLIGARFFQGAAGAVTSSVILGMIVTMFPERREQAKAISVYTFVAAAGGSVGLLAGGVLTQALNWHWIFFVNVPIGIVAVFLAVRVLASEAGLGLGAGADLPGAILVTSALMLGVYTIVQVEVHGWGSAHTLGFGALALGLLAAFLIRQATARNPLLPLRVFRSRNVSGANVVQVLMIVGMFGMFFLGALYLQRVRGYDPLQVGLAFLPLALVFAGLSLGSVERLITRFGARTVLLSGMGFVVVGLLLLARLPVESDYVFHLLPSMLLIGVGGGVSFPSLMTLAMSGATSSDAGLASGLVNTTAQVGGALGLAVLATTSTLQTELLLADGATLEAALTGGYRLAFTIGAGLAAAGMVLAAAVLRSEANTEDAPAGRSAGADVAPSV